MPLNLLLLKDKYLMCTHWKAGAGDSAPPHRRIRLRDFGRADASNGSPRHGDAWAGAPVNRRRRIAGRTRWRVVRWPGLGRCELLSSGLYRVIPARHSWYRIACWSPEYLVQ